MEKNANDKLIWVDLFDNEIGSGEKLETHVKNQLHRAFSLFIIHDGKMLIQKRALEKYHSGGLWANACCSHPRWGESLTDAVQKRMEEELGRPESRHGRDEIQLCETGDARRRDEQQTECQVRQDLLVAPLEVEPEELLAVLRLRGTVPDQAHHPEPYR